MSHDPCIVCQSRDGEILLDGDAPPITVCSYECLTEWAEEQAEDRYICSYCSETFWDSDVAVDGLGPVCPHCERRQATRI
jgi:DNA-directed RNA polymerase subunit RPC12/RpoP